MLKLTIRKKFVGSGWFNGTVMTFDDVSKTFSTAYEDDNVDQMGFAAIARWLPATHACLLKTWLSDSTRGEAKSGNKQAEARAASTSIKVEDSGDESYDYDGAYDCVICSESVRGTAALQCSKCSSNPFHHRCVAGSFFVETCPQCAGKTVVPWSGVGTLFAFTAPVASIDLSANVEELQELEDWHAQGTLEWKGAVVKEGVENCGGVGAGGASDSEQREIVAKEKNAAKAPRETTCLGSGEKLAPALMSLRKGGEGKRRLETGEDGETTKKKMDTGKEKNASQSEAEEVEKARKVQSDSEDDVPLIAKLMQMNPNPHTKDANDGKNHDEDEKEREWERQKERGRERQRERMKNELLREGYVEGALDWRVVVQGVGWARRSERG